MYPRSTFASLFVLFLLWGILWIVRHAFGGNKVQQESASGQEATAGEQPRSNQPQQQQANDAMATKLNKASNALRDSLLVLLVVLFLNAALSSGPTRSVLALSWILLFFAVIWALVEAVFSHRFVTLGFSLVVYALAIVIGALAFANSAF